jgi:hypothetical protein
MKKLISIVAVWDEQNMLPLSLESTKDIVYEYIIIIKPGIDKTKEVIKLCEKKWNLRVKIIDSDLKLRDARKYAVEISKDYADYYLIQDGDEIYYTEEELKSRGQKTITEIMNEDFYMYNTAMIYLKDDLRCTISYKEPWIVPHPFFFKNIPEIFWPDKGDMPAINYDWNSGKSYKKNEYIVKSPPYKFDVNIKNFRRQFLRSLFTAWHDGNYRGTIEEYTYENDNRVKWYLQNVDKDCKDIEIIIKFYEKNHKPESNLYKEEEFCPYPNIIRKYIDIGLYRGIENLDDLDKIK